MGEKDIAERSLMSYGDVLADIYNVPVFGGRRLVNPNDLHYALCRNWYFNNGNLHDMHFWALRTKPRMTRTCLFVSLGMMMRTCVANTTVRKSTR